MPRAPPEAPDKILRHSLHKITSTNPLANPAFKTPSEVAESPTKSLSEIADLLSEAIAPVLHETQDTNAKLQLLEDAIAKISKRLEGRTSLRKSTLNVDLMPMSPRQRFPSQSKESSPEHVAEKKEEERQERDAVRTSVSQDAIRTHPSQDMLAGALAAPPISQEMIEAALANAIMPFQTTVEASLDRLERLEEELKVGLESKPRLRLGAMAADDSMGTGKSTGVAASPMPAGSPGSSLPRSVLPRNLKDTGHIPEESIGHHVTHGHHGPQWGPDDLTATWNRLSKVVAKKRCIAQDALLTHAALLEPGSMQRFLRCMAQALGWYDGLEEPERTGCMAKFVDSRWFAILSYTVILVNAFALAYTTNRQMDNPRDELSVAVNTIFLIFYTVEIAVKLCVHRLYFFHGDDQGWNTFDFLLVVVGLWDQVILRMFRTTIGVETVSLRTVRVLRLARVLRVAQVLRIFTGLRLILETVIYTLSAFFWSLVLLFVSSYMFALITVQCMADYLAQEGDDVNGATRDLIMDNFGSIQQAMLSFFKVGTNGEQWAVYYAAVEPTGPVNCAIFILIVGLIRVSLLNILTAIFIEQVVKLAQPDKEIQAADRQLQVRREAEELRTMVIAMDAEHSGKISVEEFKHHMGQPRFRAGLSVLGLEVTDAHHFFDMLISSGGDEDKVEIDTFIEGCMRMRGSATSIDQHIIIVEMRRLRKHLKHLHDNFLTSQNKLDEINGKVRNLETLDDMV